MRRRKVLALLGGAAVSPLAARAQRPMLPRIGYLFSFKKSESEAVWQACRLGLRELGYKDGETVLLESRWAEGQYGVLAQLAKQLVEMKCNVIVSSSTPASLAAQAAVGTTPLVFVAVSDPVGVGLVSTLSRPAGNVTGFSLLSSDLSGKRLALLTEIAGKLSRVVILRNPNNAVSAIFLEHTLAAAKLMAIALQSLDVTDSADIEGLFTSDKLEQAEALIVFDDPTLWNNRKLIVRLAATRKLPTMYGFRDFADEGGLIYYGPDRLDQYRRTATYVDKILKGSPPGDLPVEQPVKFELIINMKTAKSLGLTVPPLLLARADEVIE